MWQLQCAKYKQKVIKPDPICTALNFPRQCQQFSGRCVFLQSCLPPAFLGNPRCRWSSCLPSRCPGHPGKSCGGWLVLDRSTSQDSRRLDVWTCTTSLDACHYERMGSAVLLLLNFRLHSSEVCSQSAGNIQKMTTIMLWCELPIRLPFGRLNE